MVKCDVILNHKRAQGEGGRCLGLLLLPCSKVLKPNFQSMISQTNNGCSLLLLILAKLLLLNVSCKNILALSMVIALTACPFSMKSNKPLFQLYYCTRTHQLTYLMNKTLLQVIHINIKIRDTIRLITVIPLSQILLRMNMSRYYALQCEQNVSVIMLIIVYCTMTFKLLHNVLYCYMDIYYY